MKIGQNQQKWWKTSYNVPLDPLNSPGCLSMHREHLFSTIRYLCMKSITCKSIMEMYIIPQIAPNSCEWKRTLIFVRFQLTSQCGPLNTLTLGGKNMIQISWIVPEIWPVKLKSRGARIYSSRQVYLAKYGICGGAAMGFHEAEGCVKSHGSPTLCYIVNWTLKS